MRPHGPRPPSGSPAETKLAPGPARGAAAGPGATSPRAAPPRRQGAPPRGPCAGPRPPAPPPAVWRDRQGGPASAQEERPEGGAARRGGAGRNPGSPRARSRLLPGTRYVLGPAGCLRALRLPPSPLSRLSPPAARTRRRPRARAHGPQRQ